jgi:LysM repeat protein
MDQRAEPIRIRYGRRIVVSLVLSCIMLASSTALASDDDLVTESIPRAVSPFADDIITNTIPPPGVQPKRLRRQTPDVTPVGPNSTWTWDGATGVTVVPGDTLDTLSQRYGVPVEEIVRANKLAPVASIVPGQRIVIPRSPNATVGAPHADTATMAPAKENAAAP